MGSPSEIRQLTPAAAANLDAFNRTVVHDGELDTVAAFDDAVVALGSPQTSKDTRVRRIEVVRFDHGEPTQVYEHEMTTDPAHDGGSSVDDPAWLSQ